jgi:methyltransferase-like protein
MRGMIREMLFHHANRGPQETAERRVARARALLDFLSRAVPPGNDSYGMLLREQSESLRQHSDSYLFHEHLEEHNEPLYFLQFCERLAVHDLRYLGEAEFHSMVGGVSFRPEIQHELNELAPTLIEKEQYMDFVRCRTFRQTLVCHAHARPNYHVSAEQVTALAVASPARLTSEAPDLASEAPEEFTTPGGLTLTTSTPIMKAALACLGECWPRALPFAEVRARAQARLGAAMDTEGRRPDAQTLARALLSAYATGGTSLVELSLRPPAFTTEVSERPVASPLARFQAANEQPITNLRHGLVRVTPFDRHLLPHLDGTHDRQGLLAALLERLRQGQLQIEEDEKPVADGERAQRILAEVLDQQLPKLAAAALLIA